MKLKVDMDDDGVDDLEVSIPSLIAKGKIMKLILISVASISAMVGSVHML